MAKFVKLLVAVRQALEEIRQRLDHRPVRAEFAERGDAANACTMSRQERRPRRPSATRWIFAVGTLSEDDPEITATPLLRDKLMFVYQEDHRFARRKSVHWAELKDEPLITVAAVNPLRSIVEHNLIRVVPNYRPKYEVRFSRPPPA